MTARQDDDGSSAITLQRNQCLRISGVADILDISISSVRRLIRDGQLESIRIGSSVRVPEVSLERLLNAGRRRSRRKSKK
jgi:excisionase family DNA binding protein